MVLISLCGFLCSEAKLMMMPLRHAIISYQCIGTLQILNLNHYCRGTWGGTLEWAHHLSWISAYSSFCFVKLMSTLPQKAQKQFRNQRIFLWLLQILANTPQTSLMVMDVVPDLLFGYFYIQAFWFGHVYFSFWRAFWKSMKMQKITNFIFEISKN